MFIKYVNPLNGQAPFYKAFLGPQVCQKAPFPQIQILELRHAPVEGLLMLTGGTPQLGPVHSISHPLPTPYGSECRVGKETRQKRDTGSKITKKKNNKTKPLFLLPKTSLMK
jgi:hypothetical protein